MPQGIGGSTHEDSIADGHQGQDQAKGHPGPIAFDDPLESPGGKDGEDNSRKQKGAAAHQIGCQGGAKSGGQVAHDVWQQGDIPRVEEVHPGWIKLAHIVGEHDSSILAVQPRIDKSVVRADKDEKGEIQYGLLEEEHDTSDT